MSGNPRLINNNQNPLVSVIIPVYNRTTELERAIRSVLNQSYKKFEIIVVDDGSDVDIVSICDSFGDKRIHFFRCDEHKNASSARNRGMQESKGKYIAMLDSDDEFLPHHLERRIEKINKWNCDGIFGSAYFVVGERTTLSLSRQRHNNESMLNYLLSDGYAPTPSHFYKKKAAIEIMWNEALGRHEDFDFSVRFSDRFSFLSDYKPTVTVHHLPSRDRKNVDLSPCIKFIDMYEEEISPRVYNSYHLRMFSVFSEHNNVNYIKYYSKNSYRYIHFVSYADFLFAHKKNKKFDVFIFLKFTWLNSIYLAKKAFRIL